MTESFIMNEEMPDWRRSRLNSKHYVKPLMWRVSL